MEIPPWQHHTNKYSPAKMGGVRGRIQNCRTMLIGVDHVVPSFACRHTLLSESTHLQHTHNTISTRMKDKHQKRKMATCLNMSLGSQRTRFDFLIFRDLEIMILQWLSCILYSSSFFVLVNSLASDADPCWHSCCDFFVVTRPRLVYKVVLLKSEVVLPLPNISEIDWSVASEGPKVATRMPILKSITA